MPKPSSKSKESSPSPNSPYTVGQQVDVLYRTSTWPGKEVSEHWVYGYTVAGATTHKGVPVTGGSHRVIYVPLNRIRVAQEGAKSFNEVFGRANNLLALKFI